MLQFLIVCLFSCVLGFDLKKELENTITFDVKPGGKMEVIEESWKGFTCKFSSQSQGGTKEQWLMKMEANSDVSQFSCSVERPGHESYLFFQTFTLELTGGRVTDVEVAGENHKPLGAAEFKFDPDSGKVSDAPGKFGNHLTGVGLLAVQKKQEL